MSGENEKNQSYDFENIKNMLNNYGQFTEILTKFSELLNTMNLTVNKTNDYLYNKDVGISDDFKKLKNEILLLNELLTKNLSEQIGKMLLKLSSIVAIVTLIISAIILIIDYNNTKTFNNEFKEFKEQIKNEILIK